MHFVMMDPMLQPRTTLLFSNSRQMLENLGAQKIPAAKKLTIANNEHKKYVWQKLWKNRKRRINVRDKDAKRLSCY